MRATDALDLQIDLAKWWKSEMADRYLNGFITDTLQKNGMADRMADRNLHPGPILHRALATAPTYLMESNIVQTVWSASQIMPDQPVLPQDLPTPSGFLVLERPIYFRDIHGRRMGVQGLLWWCDTAMSEGLNLAYFTHRDDLGDDYVKRMLDSGQDDLAALIRSSPMSLCHLEALRWGRTVTYALKEEIDWDAVRETAIAVGDKDSATEDLDPDEWDARIKDAAIAGRFVFAFWAFSMQKLVQPCRSAPDRALRKRLTRSDLQTSGDVLIVRLRAKEQHRRDDEPEPELVEWSHRWIVRGHWHGYWHGDGKGGKVLRQQYLAPYIKGPEDKPLVVKDTVFVVNR